MAKIDQAYSVLVASNSIVLTAKMSDKSSTTALLLLLLLRC